MQMWEDNGAHIPTNPQDDIWDVVVVGTGAGGGTAGFNLARLGRKVLFIERGAHLLPDWAANASRRDPAWWPDAVGPKGNASEQAPIGCCVGGSTSIFGMVLERLSPLDFEPGRYAHGLNTSLPATWPIEYSDLEPYYRQAETLFRVRGTDDPLAPGRSESLLPPPEPSAAETSILDRLGKAGLHPYRVHTACDRVDGCDGCFIARCPRQCRNDAARMCVQPALQQYGAHLLPECHVIKLEVHRDRVKTAVCSYQGREIRIRGRVFVLGLHALLTPALLLRSACEEFPNGLGNDSGLVGRNLMMHVVDSAFVHFGDVAGARNTELHHGVAFNDFYVSNGRKLGNVQAHAADLGAAAASSDSRDSLHFFSILEDFPYRHNRITIDGQNAVRWDYAWSDDLAARRRAFLELVSTTLARQRDVSVLTQEVGLGIPHACGTCRFGNDARDSVLDRNNRVHDLENLYVVDASFFPSSGGVNPSLTIVANSLRVSEKIALTAH